MCATGVERPDTTVAIPVVHGRVKALREQEQKQRSAWRPKQPVDDVQGNRKYAFHISNDSSSTICANIGGVKLEMLVDSGATSNIISGGKNLRPRKYGPTPMQHLQMEENYIQMPQTNLGHSRGLSHVK